MKFKTIEKTCIALMVVAFVLGTTFAFVGLSREVTGLYDWSLIAAFVFFTMFFAGLISWGVLLFGFQGIASKGILKDYGTPESKNKSYYFFTKGNLEHRIFLDIGAQKKLRILEFRFNLLGVRYIGFWGLGILNKKGMIFLWKAVERIKIEKGEIFIYLRNQSEPRCTFRDTEVFYRLIKTFWGKAIEGEDLPYAGIIEQGQFNHWVHRQTQTEISHNSDD